MKFLPTPSFFLILTIWIASFAGVRADGSRYYSEAFGTEGVSNSGLHPVSSSGDVTVVEFCPEEDFFRGFGVVRELLVGHVKGSVLWLRLLSLGKTTNSLMSLGVFTFIGDGLYPDSSILPPYRCLCSTSSKSADPTSGRQAI